MNRWPCWGVPLELDMEMDRHEKKPALSAHRPMTTAASARRSHEEKSQTPPTHGPGTDPRRGTEPDTMAPVEAETEAEVTGAGAGTLGTLKSTTADIHD